jgi:hypothetical protein
MQILGQQQYRNSGNYNGTPCSISAYQIAVLVDAQNPNLRGNLPIGGAGVGPLSFAQGIAWHLSREINDRTMPGLEIQFFSIAGLDGFPFDGGNQPSSNEFSMFRLTKLSSRGRDEGAC